MQEDGLTSSGRLSGLWGGAGNVWSNGVSTFLMMGQYSGNPQGGALFTADITGDAAHAGNVSSSGFIGGRIINNSIETDVVGFYIKPGKHG